MSKEQTLPCRPCESRDPYSVHSRENTAYGSRQPKSGIPDLGYFYKRQSRAGPTLCARFAGLAGTTARFVGAAAISACTGMALAQQGPTPQPKQPPQQQQPQQKLTIGFVEIEGDPRYEPIQGSDRIVLKARAHPFTGAEVGIDEAAALTRVLRTDFALERITVKSAEEVAPAVTQAIGRNIHFFLVDAPAEAFKPLAAAIRGADALAFNVS